MAQIPSEGAVVPFHIFKLFPVKYFATKVVVLFVCSKIKCTNISFGMVNTYRYMTSSKI